MSFILIALLRLDTVYSYNYAGGRHLAYHDYVNCIRREENYCSSAYYAGTEEFQVSNMLKPELTMYDFLFPIFVSVIYICSGFWDRLYCTCWGGSRN